MLCPVIIVMSCRHLLLLKENMRDSHDDCAARRNRNPMNAARWPGGAKEGAAVAPRRQGVDFTKASDDASQLFPSTLGLPLEVDSMP
jgi:hypothetical protein